MTNRQIGELAIGILALYLGIQALFYVSLLVGADVGRGRSPALFLIPAFPALAYFAVAGALWRGRKPLADRIFPIPEVATLPARAATIAIGIIGLLTIVGVTHALGGFLTQITSGSEYLSRLQAIWIGVVPLIAAALVAGFLIFRSQRIVAYLTSASADDQQSDAAPIAFAAVGVYMAATAFPRIVSIWLGMHVRGVGMRYDWRSAAAPLAENALILLLGLGLFLGSAGLARAWRNIHSMPTLPPGNEE